MSRRSSLPGADELFRRTEPPASAARGGPELRAVPQDVEGQSAPEPAGPASGGAARTGSRRKHRAGEPRPTGRERHDEKITVYLSSEELLALEHAKLALRGEHGIAVDRGRIVREAIAVVVADLASNGEDSTLVRRMRGL